MDFSKFKTSDWLIVGGGIGILIFGLFVDWQTVSSGPFSVSGGNAFDFFFTGTVPWLIIIAAAVITVLQVMEKMDSTKLPWPMIIALATILAAVLLLIRFLFNPGAPDGVGRGMGLIVSFLSGLVAAAGGVMGFTAAGGDLKDLADVDKLKGAFDSDSGSGDSDS